MTDDEIAKALDGKLGTHMLSGLFQELVETHRNHKSPHGYENLRKLLAAFVVQPVAETATIVSLPGRRDDRQTKHSPGPVVVHRIDGDTALVSRKPKVKPSQVFWVSLDRLKVDP